MTISIKEIAKTKQNSYPVSFKNRKFVINMTSFEPFNLTTTFLMSLMDSAILMEQSGGLKGGTLGCVMLMFRLGITL